ncbi:MAG: hypothetical protein QXI37_01480 [Thermoprotei archaeon]
MYAWLGSKVNLLNQISYAAKSLLAYLTGWLSFVHISVGSPILSAAFALGVDAACVTLCFLAVQRFADYVRHRHSRHGFPAASPGDRFAGGFPVSDPHKTLSVEDEFQPPIRARVIDSSPTGMKFDADYIVSYIERVLNERTTSESESQAAV